MDNSNAINILNSKQVKFSNFYSKYDRFLNSKEKDSKISPASLTKIATGILTIENLNLDEIITIKQEDYLSIPPDYVLANLTQGEKISIRDLLHLTMIGSKNDAANALGRILKEKTSKDFKDLTNELFSRLNIKNTSFTNPYGKDEDSHYTTLNDLLLLTNYAMKNKTFKEIVRKSSFTFKNNTIPNTNKYLRSNSTYFNPKIVGVKTGNSDNAHYCIICAKEINDSYIFTSCTGLEKEYFRYITGDYLFEKAENEVATIENNIANLKIIAKEDNINNPYSVITIFLILLILISSIMKKRKVKKLNKKKSIKNK